MTPPLPDAPYTLRTVEQMLGLGRGVVTRLVDAGFVAPVRGPRNEYRFSFQDVVLLRTAHDLRAARVPTRRLLQSLRQLKSKLPTDVPLSGLRIKAFGSTVAVRDASANWEDVSGQLLLDFEVASRNGTVAILQSNHKTGSEEEGRHEETRAQECFDRAGRLEAAADAAGAEAAYRETLALAPKHADSYVNLGALLCEGGRGKEAVQLLDQGVRGCPSSPLIHFNRAMALEDLGRIREALASYERCLELDPDLADAHFNAAILHEKLGQAQGAVRHYSAYRRLRG